MRRLAFFVCGVLLALGLIWLLVEDETVHPPAAVAPEPIPEVIEEPPLPETPSEEGEQLEIVGRLFRGGAPLVGAEVVLGDQRVTTGAFGVFVFEPVVRPRFMDLEVRSEGGAVAHWQNVVTGGTDAPLVEVPSSAVGAAATEGTPLPPPDQEAPPPGADDALGVPPNPLDVEPMLVIAGGPPQATDGEAALPGSQDLPRVLGRLLWTIHLEIGQASPPPSEWIRVREGFAAQWERGGRVRLRGGCSLPAGTQLTASAYFERLRSFASFGSFKVEGGAFETDMFSHPEKKLYSACYDIRVTFNQILQSRELKQEVLRADPDAPLALLQNTEDRVDLFLGDPAEAVAQDDEAQEYFASLWEESRFLFLDLEQRRRELERLARHWDPALLQAYTEARQGSLEPRFFDDDGRFDEQRWRRYLDDSWRARLKELQVRHEERVGRKYADAWRHGDQVLAALERLSQVYSAFRIYPAYQLKGPHPNDFYRDAYEAGDAAPLLRTIRRSSYELERFGELVSSGRECVPEWRSESDASTGRGF